MERCIKGEHKRADAQASQVATGRDIALFIVSQFGPFSPVYGDVNG